MDGKLMYTPLRMMRAFVALLLTASLTMSAVQAQMPVPIIFPPTASGGGGGTLLRSDDFNRADSTSSLGSPSGGGSAWVAQSGTWGISTNRAYESSGGAGNLVAALEASNADVDVQVTIAAGGATLDHGIVARLADNNNYLLWAWTSGGAGLRMFKQVGGSFTQLGTAAYTMADGDVMKFTVHGSTLNGYVNGVLKVGPITDGAGSTNTKHGLRVSSDATVRFDDFSITAN